MHHQKLHGNPNPLWWFTLSLTRLRIQGAPWRGLWKEKAVAGLFIRYGKPQCCEPLDSCFRSLHSVQSEFRSTDHGSAFLDPYFHLNTLRQAYFFIYFHPTSTFPIDSRIICPTKNGLIILNICLRLV